MNGFLVLIGLAFGLGENPPSCANCANANSTGTYLLKLLYAVFAPFANILPVMLSKLADLDEMNLLAISSYFLKSCGLFKSNSWKSPAVEYPASLEVPSSALSWSDFPNKSPKKDFTNFSGLSIILFNIISLNCCSVTKILDFFFISNKYDYK